MPDRNFMKLLQARWDEGKFVCVGLDSDLCKLPKHLVKELPPTDAQMEFNKAIVSGTSDLVCAYKPNLAFYRGGNGKYVLRDTIKYVHEVAPGVPVILDPKQGDIGSSNDGYVEEDFGWYEADAVTINPYLGLEEGLQPFIDQTNKGIIVLCKTSNKGSGEFQDLMVHSEGQYPTERLYSRVARRVANEWNGHGNCALVVGATYPDQLAEVRSIVGDMPILIPAIGSQGGDLEATVRAGINSRGQGMIINNARKVIFASGGEDFPDAARSEVQRMNDDITAVLATV